MSEQTPPREIRMVDVLRPRFDISPQLTEDLFEFLEPKEGFEPRLIGVFATRTVYLDALAVHADAYTKKLLEQRRQFQDHKGHIHFGIARTSRNQNIKLPPMVQFKDLNDGRVRAALKPRLTQNDTFNKLVSVLNFDHVQNNEYLRPYEDSQSPNGSNYLIAEFENAKLRQSDFEFNRFAHIRDLTERAADLQGRGFDYYATTLEIHQREAMRYVEHRPLRLPSYMFGSEYHKDTDVA